MIRQFPLVSNHGGETFEEGSSLTRHTSCARQDQGSESGPLNVTNTLAVTPLFLEFILMVDALQCLRTVGRSIRVKDLDIKKCLLSCSLKPAGLDFESGIIIPFGSPQAQTFTSKGLKRWFS